MKRSRTPSSSPHVKKPRGNTTKVSPRWTQDGVTLAVGDGLTRLSYPYGLHVARDQTIYVADYCNHRIVEWGDGGTRATVVAGGNQPGSRLDQLNGPTHVFVDTSNDSLVICDYGNRRIVRWPRKDGPSGEKILANIDCMAASMDSDGFLYASDCKKHEVRRWKIGEADGVLVAGGNDKGSRLDQLNSPTYVFVDRDRAVYISDGGNNRVIKWMPEAKTGTVVAGGRGKGGKLTQLANPYTVLVDELDAVYVADYSNDRVVRWPKGATKGTVIAGDNGRGSAANQLVQPVGLAFDQLGNLYVADTGNDRVQKYTN